LATDPRIDPTRIGHIGFSRGGAIALHSAVEPMRQAVIAGAEPKYATHVAVYPPCDETFWTPAKNHCYFALT